MHSFRSCKSDILPRSCVGVDNSRTSSWHVHCKKLPLTKSTDDGQFSSSSSFDGAIGQPDDDQNDSNILDTSFSTSSLHGLDKRARTSFSSAETENEVDDDSMWDSQTGNSEMLQYNEASDSFTKLASMNVNTNGKNAWGVNLDMMGAETASSEACLKKIKCINMGEVPLKPVGLSLSGSGMQLYVKMGPKQKKPSASRSRKPKAKTNVRADVHNTMTQTVNLPTPVIRNHKNVGDSMETNSGFLIPDSSKSKVCENHPCLDASKPMNLDVAANWERDELLRNGIKDETTQVDFYPPCKKKPNKKCQKRVRDCSPNNPTTSDSATLITVTETSRQRRNTQPMISGPSWTFENGKIDVDHCPRSNKRLGFRDAPDPGASDTPMGPPYFTSNDLPLRRLAKQTKKFRKDESYISPRSQAGKHCKTRHHPADDEFRNRLPFDDQNASSDDNDDICKVNWDDRDKYKMKKCSHLTKNVPRCNSNVSMEAVCHVQNKEVETKASGLSSVTANNVTKTESNDFDSGQFTPSVLDAVTLEKFTEYTQNMRKDLKQNYKNLSHLMNDFNHKILERNNNKCSQCHSSINDTGCSSQNNKKQGGCLLM